MAATSNHIGDIAIWIEKVINSCETPMQEIGARHLIQLFEKMLLRQDIQSYEFYTWKLRDLLDTKLYARAGKSRKVAIDIENDIM